MTIEPHWAMHGYAAYVWSAYGLVGAVLLFQLWLAVRTKASLLKQLARWLKRQSS